MNKAGNGIGRHWCYDTVNDRSSSSVSVIFDCAVSKAPSDTTRVYDSAVEAWSANEGCTRQNTDNTGLRVRKDGEDDEEGKYDCLRKQIYKIPEEHKHYPTLLRYLHFWRFYRQLTSLDKTQMTKWFPPGRIYTGRKNVCDMQLLKLGQVFTILIRIIFFYGDLLPKFFIGVLEGHRQPGLSEIMMTEKVLY